MKPAPSRRCALLALLSAPAAVRPVQATAVLDRTARIVVGAAPCCR